MLGLESRLRKYVVYCSWRRGSAWAAARFCQPVSQAFGIKEEGRV